MVRMTESPDLTRPDTHRFWIDEHVRFADLDTLGHVNNNAIGVYFEQARVALTHEFGGFREGCPWTVVLARSVNEFKAELRFPAAVRVGLRVLRLGNSSVVLGGGLFHEDRCIATQEAVCVIVDAATHRPAPIPDPVRAALARF